MPPAGPNQFLVRAAGGIKFIGAFGGQSLLDNHAVVIRNDAVGGGPDVLALRTSESDANAGVNFITFFDGDGDAYGTIEGNGTDGVVYKTTGGDYAEYLPRLSVAEEIQEGDIVGVFAGRVTRSTQGAHRIMVVTDRPAVTGNMPTPGEEADYERIAFVGLVSVKVVGPVSVGEYIVPSGMDDGTGVAISAEELSADDLGRIAGRAWEASSDPGVKGVMLEIGLDQSAAAGHVLRAADGVALAAIQGLYELVQELQAENEQMRAAMERAGIE